MSHDLGVDLRTACPAVARLSSTKIAAPLAEHQSVARGIEGPAWRSCGLLFIVDQRRAWREPGDDRRAEVGFHPAGDHHVGCPLPDHFDGSHRWPDSPLAQAVAMVEM